MLRGVSCCTRAATGMLILTVLLAASASARERRGRGAVARAHPTYSVLEANATAARRADSPPAPKPGGSGARAPATPPLTGGAGAGGAASGVELDRGVRPGGEADPLVSNGLGSPLCSGSAAGIALSAASRHDCETSGFVAAAAPTGNFGIDVHIDTGLLPSSSGGLLRIVQDLFVTPLWMALVWMVHALVVMLEWCFTIDLLDSGSVSTELANGLRQMQAAFTTPWLVSVLAVGAVLCAYNGLVRRRVADSLAQALLALAMIVCGSWVMLDPTGTIGALSGWANQASLGTLAVTARGTPVGAEQALADSMGTVFAAVVEVPWCYLEFGDVGWCRNPARLDPRLHSAALAIASAELDGIGCGSDGTSLGACVSAQGAEAKALERAARLLRAARTNGAIFLALPANGSARNAINDSRSLLRTLCQSDEATNCRGPTAAEAEFRTNHGTWPRVAGLLLIAFGALGMLLLLGFVALQLLTSAIFSLLYLMLAPAVVLTPALGEAGRALFRRWLARLLGAVVSKLLFSFLLGAILAILANLEALGWWTQWLLMSAFWWGAFTQRHQALQLATGRYERDRAGGRRAVVRRFNEALDARRRAFEGVQAARKRFSKPAPEVSGESSSGLPGRQASRSTKPATGVPERTRLAGLGRANDSTGAQATPHASSIASRRARVEHIDAERARALAAGNARRAALLGSRAQRLEAEQSPERSHLVAPEDGLDRSRAAAKLSDSTSSRAERMRRRERFLDAQQARAPSDEARRSDVTQRSYGALAGLAGYGRREYARLGSNEQRVARVRIDRELALRQQQVSIARGGATLREVPAAAPEHATVVARRRPTQPPKRHDPHGSAESELMRDARAVAAKRKRQLGKGRP